MKRILSLITALSLILTLVMMLALVSFESKPAAPSAPTPDQSVTDEVGDASQAPDADAPAVEGETPAQQLYAAFQAFINSGTPYACESVAAALIENEELIPFAGAYMEVEPGFLNGFTEEIDGFEDGATFGPMIGSIPFVGYIFQVPDGDDVNAFMENLKSKADLRWNICTQADEMVCEAIGNTVFFVMAPATFDDAQ